MTPLTEDDQAALIAGFFFSAVAGWFIAGVATQHPGLMVSGGVAAATGCAIFWWTTPPKGGSPVE